MNPKRHIIKDLLPGDRVRTMCGKVLGGEAAIAFVVPTYSHRLSCESCRRARNAQGRNRHTLEEATK